MSNYGHVGHVVRKHNSLGKEVIRGCTSGSRSRGQQQRRWTDDIPGPPKAMNVVLVLVVLGIVVIRFPIR